MQSYAEKKQESKAQAIANRFSNPSNRISSAVYLVDNRPEAIAHRKLKSMASNSLQVKQSVQHQHPIQMMVWTYNGISWQPTSWEGVDYSKMPKDKTKPEGTKYDDTTGTYTYPEPEAIEEVDDSPAGIERREKIQPFLDLMDHLAGENDGSTSKGGHLLLAMEAKWRDAFMLLNPEARNEDGVWQAHWSINGQEKGWWKHYVSGQLD